MPAKYATGSTSCWHIITTSALSRGSPLIWHLDGLGKGNTKKWYSNTARCVSYLLLM